MNSSVCNIGLGERPARVHRQGPDSSLKKTTTVGERPKWLKPWMSVLSFVVLRSSLRFTEEELAGVLKNRPQDN